MNMIYAIVLSTVSLSAGVFVAPDGSDTNAGTKEFPFKTIGKAVSLLTANDTIFVRGGTYTVSATIAISKKGSVSDRYTLFAFPGERPLLDCSGMAVSGSNRGISLSGSYWHIKGLDIKGAGDNGMHVSGSYNTIEFCSFFENRDTGLQLSNGASYNTVINCDSYYNADPGNGNADGFAPKLDVGTGNSFFGCRAWQNSDDGWDGYLRGANDVTTVYERCWVFKNGYLKDGSPSSGNGNGFKLGGGDSGNVSNWAHNVLLKHCVAFDNRVKGFDQNNNAGTMTIYHGTASGNGTNYSIPRALAQGKTLTIKNSVSLGPVGSLGAFALQEKNGWMAPFNTTNEDFISVDASSAYGPRKADGSLPDITFLHLQQGSDLIDGGVDLGSPYVGSAPDLGAFEYSAPTSVRRPSAAAEQFLLEQNFPNPFNPTTTITFRVAVTEDVSLTVFNTLGQEVHHLFNGRAEAGKTYVVPFDASRLSSGIYFYRLRSQQHAAAKTMVYQR